MSYPLLDIIISFDGITYPNTFRTDREIDRSNLEHEFLTHAEKYHYYASMATEAARKAAHLEFQVKLVYAQVDCEKRQIAAATTQKYTERMYENEVLTDPRYIKAKRDHIDANYLAEQINECAKALVQKRDMLVQLGGIAKQTLQPQRLVEQQAATARQIIAQNHAQRQLEAQPEPTPPPQQLTTSASVLETVATVTETVIQEQPTAPPPGEALVRRRRRPIDPSIGQ